MNESRADLVLTELVLTELVLMELVLMELVLTELVTGDELVKSTGTNTRWLMWFPPSEKPPPRSSTSQRWLNGGNTQIGF